MNYRIETKEAFRILGVSTPLSRNMEKNPAIVAQMWQDCMANGTLAKLSQMASAAPAGILGISLCEDEEPWQYVIAVATEQTNPKFKEYTIPEATWAIFPGSGTNQTIQELRLRIYGEWLPASGYGFADNLDIEVYINPDPENTVFELWVPVHKRS